MDRIISEFGSTWRGIYLDLSLRAYILVEHQTLASLVHAILGFYLYKLLVYLLESPET